MGQIIDRPNSHIFAPVAGTWAVRSRIDNRMDLLNAFADNAYDITTTYITEIASLAKGLEVPDVSDINVKSPELAELDLLKKPNMSALDVPSDWPQKDFSGLSLQTIPELAVPDFPVLQVSAPAYTEHAAPTMDEIAPPGEMPGLDQIDTPVAPTIDLPSVPTFEDIVIPDAPEITLPEFDEEAPTFNIDDPEYFSWGEPTYESSIWSSLLVKVIKELEDGGTGLSASVETDIYNRHLNRVLDEVAKSQYDIENYFAARGFELPPGALAGVYSNIRASFTRATTR